MEGQLHSELHPLTPHHLPFYIAKPGETDWLMIVMGIFLIGAVLAVGNIYLRLHTLPERLAHKSQKLQFEIVAVLGLLALFTHIHLFWIAGLLLALVDLPDFGTPLGRIATSAEKIAGIEPSKDPLEEGYGTAAPTSPVDEKSGASLETNAASRKGEAHSGPPTESEVARARHKESLHA